MPIAGLESCSHSKEERTCEPALSKDPLDELIETLREEIQRGFARETARKKAARRKRIAIWTVSLLVVVGVVLIAVISRNTIHLPH